MIRIMPRNLRDAQLAFSKGRGLRTKVVEFRTAQEVQERSPSAYGVFGVVLDGNFFAYHYLLQKDFDKLIRFGLHASHAIQYKKIILGIQLGHYLYSKYTDLSKIYSRISVEYMISTHIFSKIAVKSHLAKADFIEWGIGYSW